MIFLSFSLKEIQPSDYFIQNPKLQEKLSSQISHPVDFHQITKAFNLEFTKNTKSCQT